MTADVVTSVAWTAIAKLLDCSSLTTKNRGPWGLTVEKAL
jgi:hypothetical protein